MMVYVVLSTNLTRGVTMHTRTKIHAEYAEWVMGVLEAPSKVPLKVSTQSSSQQRCKGVNPCLLNDHAMAVSRAIKPSNRKTDLAFVTAMHGLPRHVLHDLLLLIV